MKRNALTIIPLAVCMIVFSGCTINRHVKDDYLQYLRNNVGASGLPVTSLEAQYELTPTTETHKYEFRSALAGYANNWIVEFGKILDATLQSSDVQNAFKKLEKKKDTDPAALLVFDLVGYQFTDFGAHVELKVTLQKKNDSIFAKTYKAAGKTQGGKMFWAGTMGMKNAIQQSTKSAIDQILAELITDIERGVSK